MKKVIPFVALAGAFIFSGCGNPRYLYSPIEINNPDLTNEQQVFLAANATQGLLSSANTGSRSRNSGMGVQAGVSLAKGFALHGQLAQRWERGAYDWQDGSDLVKSSVSYRRSLWEAGVGYFTKLDQKEKAILSLYAGLGNARSHIEDQLTGASGVTPITHFHHSSVKRFYVQPSLNYHPGPYFNMGFSLKYNTLTFRDFNTSYSPDEQRMLDIDGLEDHAFGQWEMGLQAMMYLPETPSIGFRFMGHMLAGSNHRFESRSMFASVGMLYVFGKKASPGATR